MTDTTGTTTKPAPKPAAPRATPPASAAVTAPDPVETMELELLVREKQSDILGSTIELHKAANTLREKDPNHPLLKELDSTTTTAPAATGDEPTAPQADDSTTSPAPKAGTKKSGKTTSKSAPKPSGTKKKGKDKSAKKTEPKPELEGLARLREELKDFNWWNLLMVMSVIIGIIAGIILSFVIVSAINYKDSLHIFQPLEIIIVPVVIGVVIWLCIFLANKPRKKYSKSYLKDVETKKTEKAAKDKAKAEAKAAQLRAKADRLSS